jgi:hypothetical protein
MGPANGLQLELAALDPEAARRELDQNERASVVALPRLFQGAISSTRRRLQPSRTWLANS